ncbi:DUF1489 family protein [Sphingomonas baiyangensis]|uniref:DUF1489 family protein n=1 Tax=Sphingomonas baiyangensis TaxID=2572576 RepID=A0A4U1L6E2_9SPHN|nr:DUF1489 domain-containing protein [Sphingomonas baiyangensis]TKD51903.1 DUF1489 family protein [Sphingomonas baiyangensis]
MALHITKVAYGADSLDELQRWFAEGTPRVTTRYMPKRHDEIAGQGSLYWIHRHTLVARSPILGFGEAENGRVAIEVSPRLILVQGRPRRAHQGWRYLEAADAPPDLGEAGLATAAMPPELVGRLSALALL